MDHKREIQETCGSFSHLGPDFESLAGELIHEFGFFNVQHQLSGTQFGADFIAQLRLPSQRKPRRWYIECKNYRDVIRPAAVAEKLIWHRHHLGDVAGYILIAPGELSNDLRQLLTDHPFPFPILSWTGSSFVSLVRACPATCSKWFTAPPVDETAIGDWRADLVDASVSGFPPSRRLQLSLRHEHDPPSSVAYFYQGNRVEKWNTDSWHTHIAQLTNAGYETVLVTSVKATTISYSPLPQRILVQTKMKGIYEPLNLRYLPSTRAGSEVELMAPKALRIHPREVDVIRLELDFETTPGLYEIEFHVGMETSVGSEESSLGRVRVCVCSSDMEDSGNRLHLRSWRRHYDVMASKILDLPESEWKYINSKMSPSSLTFVGPTPTEVIPDDMQDNYSWKIQSAPIEKVEVARRGAVGRFVGTLMRMFKPNSLDLSDLPDGAMKFVGQPVTLKLIGEDRNEQLPYDMSALLSHQAERLKTLYGIDEKACIPHLLGPGPFRD